MNEVAVRHYQIGERVVYMGMEAIIRRIELSLDDKTVMYYASSPDLQGCLEKEVKREGIIAEALDGGEYMICVKMLEMPFEE